MSELVYSTAVLRLLEEEEWEAATRVLARYNEWLFARGYVEKAAERSEVRYGPLVDMG